MVFLVGNVLGSAHCKTYGVFMSFVRALFPLFLAALSAVTVAAETCSQYSLWQNFDAPGSTPQEGCANGVALMASLNPTSSYRGVSASGGNCYWEGRPKDGQWSWANTFIYSRVLQGACPDHCAVNNGRATTQGVTNGWARSSTVDADDHVGALTYPTPGGSVCIAGCRWEVLGVSVATFRSQVPSAQGLYRLSSDHQMRSDDVSCIASESDKALDPSQPDKPCPGYVGTADLGNGLKPYCAGTAANPLPPPSGSLPPGQDKGNPSAGEKPSTGEGSGTGGAGRTPSAGSGGNAGGPAGAAAGGSGTKPDGTTDKPGEGKEQAACGAPGQPPCKIDESGTPTGQAQKDDLKKAVEQAGKDTKAGIDAASKLKADGWSFTFQLPSSCSPLVLDGFSFNGGSMTLDVCRFQSMIHDLMALLWLATTVWCCVGMVGRTLRGA